MLLLAAGELARERQDVMSTVKDERLQNAGVSEPHPPACNHTEVREIVRQMRALATQEPWGVGLEVLEQAGLLLHEAVERGAFHGLKYLRLRHRIDANRYQDSRGFPENMLPHGRMFMGVCEWLRRHGRDLQTEGTQPIQHPFGAMIDRTIGLEATIYVRNNLSIMADIVEAESAQALANVAADTGNGSAAGLTPMGNRQDPLPTGDSLGTEEKALAVLLQHPTWSKTQIAKVMGRSRSTLYRCKRFMAAYAHLREERSELPRGDKDAETGDIEAWNADPERPY